MKHIRPYGIFEASPALTPEQIEWLNKCTSKRSALAKGNWELNLRTGEVDVFHGGFDCSEQDLSDFKGVRFGVVGEDFWCYDNLLTSLVGAPREVGGYFSCGHNRLTSLVGAPEKVGGSFECDNNRLTSLEGAPQKVGGGFNCNDNLLTSLEGAPQKVGGGFFCDNNLLTSLEGAPEKVRGSLSCGNNLLTSLVGAPQEVGGDFDCDKNRLTSLDGAPRGLTGHFWCGHNLLTSLEGAPEVGGASFFNDNPVSEKTLQSIFSRMNEGESYLEAVESLWTEIPLEDQALLYRPEFKWVGAEEVKKLQAVGRFNKIKGIL